MEMTANDFNGHFVKKNTKHQLLLKVEKYTQKSLETKIICQMETVSFFFQLNDQTMPAINLIAKNVTFMLSLHYYLNAENTN